MSVGEIYINGKRGRGPCHVDLFVDISTWKKSTGPQATKDGKRMCLELGWTNISLHFFQCPQNTLCSWVDHGCEGQCLGNVREQRWLLGTQKGLMQNGWPDGFWVPSWGFGCYSYSPWVPGPLLSCWPFPSPNTVLDNVEQGENKQSYSNQGQYGWQVWVFTLKQIPPWAEKWGYSYIVH